MTDRVKAMADAAADAYRYVFSDAARARAGAAILGARAHFTQHPQLAERENQGIITILEALGEAHDKALDGLAISPNSMLQAVATFNAVQVLTLAAVFKEDTGMDVPVGHLILCLTLLAVEQVVKLRDAEQHGMGDDDADTTVAEGSIH